MIFKEKVEVRNKKNELVCCLIPSERLIEIKKQDSFTYLKFDEKGLCSITNK